MTSPPPRPRRRWWIVPAILACLAVVLVATLVMVRSFSPTKHQPNLVEGIDQVTCNNVRDVSNDFAVAADQANRNRPGRFDGLRAFGFKPPVIPSDVPKLFATIQQRSAQLEAKMANGTCTDDRGLNGNGTPLAGPCPRHYVQHFDPNQHGNFVSAGVKNRNDILKAIQHDGRYLGYIGNQLGLWPGTNANKLLVPGNQCLSREGQDLYQQVHGALTNRYVAVNEHDVAPADYYNTGMVNGQPVVDQYPGIGGNLSSVSFQNKLTGGKLYVLKRCGNLALPRQTLPRGTTNNQR